MHAPLVQRSKTENIDVAAHKRAVPKTWLIAIVLAGAALAAYFERGALYEWFAGPRLAPTILVSGNIEAHQSVLGFKTVQSRIVELPFNEGQWVKAGTLIARLDDADYRQQVAIAEATLNVQCRQLAASEQTLAAARKTVESDIADLEFKKVEYDRAETLMQKGVATVELRDQAYAALRQSTAVHQRDEALR